MAISKDWVYEISLRRKIIDEIEKNNDLYNVAINFDKFWMLDIVATSDEWNECVLNIEDKTNDLYINFVVHKTIGIEQYSTEIRNIGFDISLIQWNNQNIFHTNIKLEKHMQKFIENVIYLKKHILMTLVFLMIFTFSYVYRTIMLH